jgi:hypothetical protein
MAVSKPNNQNHVEIPIKKVEIRNRLKELFDKYPLNRSEFKQYMRDSGIGDYTILNVVAGRSRYKPIHDKLVDRMLIHFNIEL